MPTALFRQILYGNREHEEGKKNDSPDSLITIMTLVFAGILLVILRLPMMSVFQGKQAYYLSLDFYFYFILAFFIFNLIAAIIPGLRKYCPLLNLVLVMAAGYLTAELVYRYSPLKLASGSVKFLGSREITHLNGFLLHRLLQFFPLVLTLGLFFAYKNKFENYFHIGSLSIQTDILNKKAPQTWGSILVKFALWLLTVLIMVLFLKGANIKGGFPYPMLIPIFLYALWNCFVEESIFRGVFLPAASEAFNPNTGNLIQAVMFGLIHINPADPASSILRAAIFTFMGWLFGKATLETKGLAVSYVMHTLIVAAVEIRLLWG